MIALKMTKDVIRSSKGAFTFGVNNFSVTRTSSNPFTIYTNLPSHKV